MRSSRVYRSLLYQNHYYGVPEDWVAISFVIWATLNTILPFWFSLVCFALLLFIGRQIYLYKDKDFASIIRQKLMTNSFSSNKHLEIKENENKFAFAEIKTLLFEAPLFYLNQTRMKNFIKFTEKITIYFKKQLNILESLDNTNNLRCITVSHIKNQFIYKTDGAVAIVLKIEGINDSINTYEEQDSNYQNRINFLKELSSEIEFSYYTIRTLEKNLVSNEYNKNKTAEKIINKWNKTFINSFINHNYIVLTCKKKNKLEKKNNLEKKKKKLVETANTTINKLNRYKPEILENKKLVSFVVSILNGRFQDNIEYKDNNIEDLFYNNFKIIPEGIKYIDGIYSTFLNFKDIPNSLEEDLIKTILKTQIELIYFFHSTSEPPQVMLEKLILKQKRQQTFSNPQIIQDEIISLTEKLDTGHLQIFHFSMGIQIFAYSKEDLEDKINILQAIFSNYGANLKNQRENILGYYYALCLEKKYHSSKRLLTDENIAMLFSPFKSEKGFRQSTFGKAITQFYTENGEIYNFNFHKNSEENSLGHTLVVGQSGAGKSILVAFLISQALKNDIKILLLDQLKGLKIPTLALEGKYYTLGETQGINPFITGNLKNNTDFIQKFIKLMIEPENQAQNIETEEAIKNFLSGKPDTLNLQELSHHLGEDFSYLKNQAKRYISGHLQNHFDGKKYQFKTENITAFDMEKIMQEPQLINLYAYYFYNQFITKNRNNKGIIFFDEFPVYLRDQRFFKLAQTFFEQLRKINKIIIGAMQSFSQFDKQQFSQISNNVETYIIFPIGRKDEKEIEYYNQIGLNNKQIDFLTYNQPDCRQVLIYKTNYSNIIYTDLQGLERYFHIFTSDSKKVELIENFMKENNDVINTDNIIDILSKRKEILQKQNFG